MNASNLADSPASADILEHGYHVFDDVLTADELRRLRDAARQLFKAGGRVAPGGGKKQANAAVEAPSVQWLFYHPRILACFREALGSETIMFTSHADIQKDVLAGWHKDDGTLEHRAEEKGYFERFAYDADDCRVYKMGVYLQGHDHDTAGLSVRDRSHRLASHAEGRSIYTATRPGSVIVFDVRITHAGQFKTGLQRRLVSRATPQGLVDSVFGNMRMAYRAALGRERIALFFTFGAPNAYTVAFAKNNMLRQLKLTPGTNPKLPANVRKAFEDNGVLLAEDQFLPELAAATVQRDRHHLPRARAAFDAGTLPPRLFPRRILIDILSGQPPAVPRRGILRNPLPAGRLPLAAGNFWRFCAFW